MTNIILYGDMVNKPYFFKLKNLRILIFKKATFGIC